MDMKFAGIFGGEGYTRAEVTEDGVLINGNRIPNVKSAKLVIGVNRLPYLELQSVVNEYHDSSHRTS